MGIAEIEGVLWHGREVTQMKPKERQGLTTEDVSRVLGVSIRTVIRYFDKGILTGWRHPATRYRLIDPKSVKTLEALKREWAVTVRQVVDDFAGR